MKIGIIFPKDSEAIFDLNSTRTFGGATVQMYTIAEELQQRADSEIFCIVPEISNLQDKYTKWNLREVFKKRGNIFKTILSFHALIKAEKPSVLLQHGLTLFSCLLAMYCKLNKIKFVFMFASDIETQGRYQSSKKKCLLFSTLLKTTNVLVVQNNIQKNLLLQKHGTKSLIFNMGFNVKSSISNEQNNLLWIGRCDPVKQPEVFIDLANSLPQYKFVMIAPVVDVDYFNKIKNMANGIQNLKIIPSVSFQETWTYFKQAMILVNTSKYEGFPQTFVQAAVCGLPIFSLNVDPDFIEKYDVGKVAGGNLQLLEKQITEYLKNNSLHSKYSKNILEYSKQNHNISENIDKILQALEYDK